MKRMGNRKLIAVEKPLIQINIRYFNFKVFFKAISKNKQGRRLILCMTFPVYLNKRNVEKN